MIRSALRRWLGVEASDTRLDDIEARLDDTPATPTLGCEMPPRVSVSEPLDGDALWRACTNDYATHVDYGDEMWTGGGMYL